MLGKRLPDSFLNILFHNQLVIKQDLFFSQAAAYIALLIVLSYIFNTKPSDYFMRNINQRLCRLFFFFNQH